MLGMSDAWNLRCLEFKMNFKTRYPSWRHVDALGIRNAAPWLRSSKAWRYNLLCHHPSAFSFLMGVITERKARCPLRGYSEETGHEMIDCPRFVNGDFSFSHFGSSVDAHGPG